MPAVRSGDCRVSSIRCRRSEKLAENATRLRRSRHTAVHRLPLGLDGRLLRVPQRKERRAGDKGCPPSLSSRRDHRHPEVDGPVRGPIMNWSSVDGVLRIPFMEIHASF